MDTAYMSALGETIRRCNRELDRVQVGQPPDVKFLLYLQEMENIVKDAMIRFYEQNGPQS